jgi:hypothetical protein
VARVRFIVSHAVAIAGMVSCSGSTTGGDEFVPLPDRGFDASSEASEEDTYLPGLPPTEAGPADAAEAGPVYMGCNGALDCERVVFATTKDFGGGFGGVTEADQRCQSHADASQSPRVKGRKFVAWVSTAASSVASRFPKGTKAYVRPDGAKIANDWADLTDGDLIVGIALNEDGAAPGGSDRVWTGTNNSGASANNTCGGWKDLQQQGQRGNLGGGGGGWSSIDNAGCANLGHLYCFEY